MSARPYTLLTGATGLIGGHLVRVLLENQVPLALLVRDSLTGKAHAKVSELVSRLEDFANIKLVRPKVVIGDFAQSGLGMSDDDRAWVSRYCGRVLHNAAHLSFKPAADHPHGEPYRTNVDGLSELIELCRSCEMTEFHHVSSAYVCGNRQGAIQEAELNCGQAFSNDYEHSKLLGEEMLRTYFENLTIYRPSIVVDPSLKLANLGDRTIYQAYSVYEYLAKMFGRPEPGDLIASVGLTGDERKNLVTAEWVARTIAHILERPQHHCKVFHLTHRVGTTMNKIDEAFCQVLAEKNVGKPRREIPDAKRFNQSTTSEQFVRTFAPYFRDDPRFDQSNVLAAYDGDALRLAPDIDVADLRRLVMTDSKANPDPTGSSQIFPKSASPWHEFTKVCLVEKLHGYRMGLILHGPGGGDWVIGKRKDGNWGLCSGGAEAADEIVCSSVPNWERWLESENEVTDLYRTGDALFQKLKSSNQECQGETLMSELRDHLSELRERV